MRTWTFIGAVGLSLAACGGDSKGGDTGATGGDEFSEELGELDGLIDGFESWEQPVPGITESGNGHPAYVENWANTAAVDTINAGGGGDMPDGAVLVKQGYNDEAGTDEGNLTVMWKTGGDWFWAAYKPDGSVQVAGYTADVQGPCVGCHESNGGQQDLVITYDW